MRTRRLGSNGPEISVVGFGAWEVGGSWGPNPPEEQILRAMHAGFDGGMNWVDTAEVYGKGTSEELVGKALAGRDDILVFTKVAPGPIGSGFKPEDVRAACEASLRRLGRDVIDLYQLHWPDEGVPLEDTWGAMAELVDDGLVRWIGVSNFMQDQIEACEKIRHVDSLQPQLSMLAWGALEVLPYCKAAGTGVIAYAPLAYGLLTGTIAADTTFHEQDWRSGTMGMSGYDRLFAPGVRERHLETVDALRPIAAKLKIPLASLALAWVFSQEGVTGAIAGSRNPDHTQQNAAAGSVTLKPKDMAKIEKVLSGNPAA